MSSTHEAPSGGSSRTNLDEIDFAIIARTLWGGKFFILLFGIIGLLAGGFYAYRVAEPRFAATTVVEFSPQESNLLDLNSVVSGTISDLAMVNTTLEFLSSRELAEEVVRRLDLMEDPDFNTSLRPETRSLRKVVRAALIQIGALEQPYQPTPEEQAGRRFRDTTQALRSAYSVTHLRETYLLTITAAASDSSKAALLSNTLADVFLEAEQEKIFESTQAAIDWLSAELLSIEAKLKSLENELAKQRLTSGVASQESLETLAVQLTDMRQRKLRREGDLVSARAELEQLAAVVDSRDTASIVAALNDPLLRRLTSAAGASLTPQDTVILERIDTVLQNRRASLQRDEQDLELINSSVDRLTTQLEDQNRDLQKVEQLQQEVSVTEDLYRTFLTGLQEATVQIGLVRNDKRILATALPPSRPESPRRLRLTAGFAVLGGVLAALAVLLRLVLNMGVLRSAEQLETMSGLPVLGEVLSTPVRKRAGVPRFYVDNPTSAAAETLRNLRTSLLMSMAPEASSTITVTSSVPGEGKTTLSLLLAINLAGLGRRVLLVEADIRRRTMGQYFDIGSHQGSFAKVMDGSMPLDQAVHKDQTLGIDVLLGDTFQENPADLFSSERFGKLIAHLGEAYDHVIFDTPPVLVVPDARIIAPQTDGLVFVVKWDATQITQVKEGLKQFRALNMQPNGLVLSNVSPRKMRRYGYGNRYGGYGKYGTGYYGAVRKS